MYVSQIFWILLLIPGYVAVRRFDGDDLDSGLMGVLGLSLLASFVLLLPVSVLCYVIGLPVWVFSATCVGLIGWGGFEIVRRKWGNDIGKLLVAGMGIELVVLLIDLVLAMRMGGYSSGDASVHMARIRFLLDHGISNLDPFCAEPYFYPIYHTNLLHVLQAACGQLTGQDHVAVWMGSLGWGKMLMASAGYFLAWTIFRNRWAAGGAALLTMVMYANSQLSLYPNQLAPFGVFPFLLAFTVQLCGERGKGRNVIKVGAGGLVIGAIHGLYAGFAVVFIVPVLVLLAILRWVRKQHRPVLPLLGAGAIGVSLVFPLVTVATSVHSSAEISVAEVANSGGHFVSVSNEWVMKDPRRGFSAVWWRPGLLFGSCLIAGFFLKRRGSWIVLGSVGTLAMILYIPPLCTTALSFLGQGWMLGRAEFLFPVCFAAMVPSLLLLSLRNWFPERWQQSVLSMLLLLGLPFYNYSYSNLKAMYQNAREPAEVRFANINRTRRGLALVAKHVPAGETVLCEIGASVLLVMLHDIHVVVSKSSSNGVPDLGQRHRDLDRMLNADTPWPERSVLLRKYGIHYLVRTWSLTPTQWAEEHGEVVARMQGIPFILKINPDS